MSVLRMASRDTVKLMLDDTDFIEVLTDLSKKDFNTLLKLMPPDYDSDKGFSPGQADDFMTALFSTLVQGWSLPGKPSMEMYLGLARDASNAVDQKLIEHFNGLQPNAQESKSGDGNSTESSVGETGNKRVKTVS